MENRLLKNARNEFVRWNREKLTKLKKLYKWLIERTWNSEYNQRRLIYTQIESIDRKQQKI